MSGAADQKAQVNITIPEDVIRAHITASVVAAIGNPDGLIRAVVDSALNTKVNTYDKQTVFGAQASGLIREVARDIFSEWLESLRPTIAAKVREGVERRLSPDRLAELADKSAQAIVDGLARYAGEGIRTVELVD